MKKILFLVTNVGVIVFFSSYYLFTNFIIDKEIPKDDIVVVEDDKKQAELVDVSTPFVFLIVFIITIVIVLFFLIFIFIKANKIKNEFQKKKSK